VHKTINSGIYILEIRLVENIKVVLGKNKEFDLPQGYYYYVGSAQKNLQSRVNRHRTKNKKIHWHIDHITSNYFADVLTVYTFENAKKEFECELRELIEKKFNLTHLIKNFGNSDCNKCESHLLYSKSPIESLISYKSLLSLDNFNSLYISTSF
jgi:Uri superfamily endonuclease